MTPRCLQALNALRHESGASHGLVYFIQGESGGPIKIGFTRYAAAESRLEDLQPGSPVRLVVRVAFPASVRAERELHRLFAASRLHGEWFAPVEELELLIAMLAKENRNGLRSYLDGRDDSAELREKVIA
jgi:hypothetical protein